MAAAVRAGMVKHKRTLQSPRLLAATALVVVLFPASVLAQSGGVRAGVSADPDQVFFGAHVEIGPVADHLSFRPNVEAGFGNNLTTVAVNFELAYAFHHRSRPWQVYVGGGPALVVYSRDTGGQRSGDTETQPGFNLLVGLGHTRGFFSEVKLGLIDSPGVKFVIGYTFR